MLEGGFLIEDRLVTLADIECPIMSVVGTVDEIAPAAGVRAIRAAAPRADLFELALRAGHFGLVVGSKSNQVTWPTVAGWARWRAGHGGLPEGLTPVADGPLVPASEAPAVHSRVGYGLELAGGVGTGVARAVVHGTRRTVRSVRELTREAAGQLPRLARLEQIQPGTRISIASLVAERRAKDTFFLYGDRAYTAGEVNGRIDNVVRGLISVGVRQGDHVGVMMGTRPSALALVVAINRLGAVSVLLRPGGDAAREAELGAVTRIIADPERAEVATGVERVHAFVLGGAGARDVGVPLSTDLERIDPAGVQLPRWYEPNPGRASDLAFVVFTGEGERTRMSRITNGRWALSAFGTASAAALSAGDTVYSVTPLHHPSGLMMSIGGAIVGGSRLAMASRFDPRTFWDEARRYGVTIASYTWTLLHDLVEAPPHPGERHHSVRLFIGSGMPRGLWRRVQSRFAPARVLEFYASTEAGAILVNVAGTKTGAMGRPLPGAAEVRVAAWDSWNGRIELKPDGFARECDADEIGMLLARVGRGEQTSTTALRGLFEQGDAWLVTGDLFRRDADGDFWRIDHQGDVIRAAGGPVFGGPIRDALGDVPAVDLAAVYGVTPDGAHEPIAVAAVSLRAGQELTERDLSGALATLPVAERPAIVHVVAAIPVTTWFRPVTGPLRAVGVPQPGAGSQVWRYDAERDRYAPHPG
jgi:putative long chain acyl-CoA synthase